MAQDFYSLLYNGYTGEYQLMSSLYRNGLDALRPPANMGIDVVSLNLKQQLEKPGTPPETFFFQVKTAVTTVSENPNRPGAFAVVEFKLKDSEVDLLARSRERALFCYVYNSEAGRSPTRSRHRSSASGLTARSSKSSTKKARSSAKRANRS